MHFDGAQSKTEAGVGVVFNAIRAKGVDTSKLPAHLGLRMALESTSSEEAVAGLRKYGLASSAHILVGDAKSATSCESSSSTFKTIGVDARGRILHTNHLIADHPGVEEPPWLADSPRRLEQLGKLTDKITGEPSMTDFKSFFMDETDWPNSICRSQVEGSVAATLFNIVMNLGKKEAIITEGRPTQPGETHILNFD